MDVIREVRAQRAGNGGDARARQISWLLARAGIDETRLGEDYEHRTFSNLSHGVEFAWREWVSVPARLPLIKRVGYRYREHKRRLESVRRPAALLWEYTASPVGPKVANRYNVPLVALPHNVESLVANERLLYTGSDRLLTRLRKELDLLRTCQRIYAISRHDQWLYLQFGVESEYLPYFPDPDRYDTLCRIREQRRKGTGDVVLLLGSAQYTPIRKGMEYLLKMLVRGGFPEHMSILVAGFGTEVLRGKFRHPRIHVEGTVSAERLRELQVESRLLLIHSREGSGALTRIPDALVAGIPVVANTLGARSTEHLAGLHVYDGHETLVRILDGEITMPPLPKRPTSYEERFVNDLLGFGGS